MFVIPSLDLSLAIPTDDHSCDSIRSGLIGGRYSTYRMARVPCSKLCSQRTGRQRTKSADSYCSATGSTCTTIRRTLALYETGEMASTARATSWARRQNCLREPVSSDPPFQRTELGRERADGAGSLEQLVSSTSPRCRTRRTTWKPLTTSPCNGFRRLEQRSSHRAFGWRRLPRQPPTKDNRTRRRRGRPRTHLL